MCRAASVAHDEPMINDITFALVHEHQQALRDRAAEDRLARTATPRRPMRLSIARRWGRLRMPRSERAAQDTPALRPATACTH